MGTLFTDSDEYPDYKSMPAFWVPALASKNAVKKVVMVFGIPIAFWTLCPENPDRHEHPPHQDHAPFGYVEPVATNVNSTTGGGDVTVGLTGVSATGYVGTVKPSITLGTIR
jgi:hypothetical protein